jgi:hypothetical protein
MTIDIQFEEAAQLLLEMHARLSEEDRKKYSSRVREVSAVLHHPRSEQAICLDVKLDGRCLPRGVVHQTRSE